MTDPQFQILLAVLEQNRLMLEAIKIIADTSFAAVSGAFPYVTGEEIGDDRLH